jgi:hypothetical protein
VAGVCKAEPFARLRERLAGAGAGPHGSVVGPSGCAQGSGPDADPGEEVALDETAQVVWPNVFNRALVNFSRSDVACSNEVS